MQRNALLKVILKHSFIGYWTLTMNVLYLLFSMSNMTVQQSVREVIGYIYLFLEEFPGLLHAQSPCHGDLAIA